MAGERRGVGGVAAGFVEKELGSRSSLLWSQQKSGETPAAENPSVEGSRGSG